MYGTYRWGAFLALLVLTAPHGATTQQPTNHPHRRWSATLLFGWNSGYSARSIEQEMTAAGMSETTQCVWFCTGSIQHPTTHPGGGSNGVVVGYRILPPLQIRGMLVGGRLGDTHGYGHGEYLFLVAKTTNVGILTALDPGWSPLVPFAGIGLDYVRAAENSYRGDSTVASRITPGFWIGAELRLPPSKRFFGTLTVARHIAPAAGFSALEVRGGSGAVVTTLDGFDVNPSFTAVSVGVGVQW